MAKPLTVWPDAVGPVRIRPITVRSTSGRPLFLVRPDQFETLNFTFTRGSTATYVDASGVLQTAASGALRSGHYVSGVRTFLLEGQRTNKCLQSENFGTTWAAIGTPTRVAAADTASGVTLDLIGDDDASVLEGYNQNCGAQVTAGCSIAVYVKQGTSTSSVIRTRDSSTAAIRTLAVITWSGTTPVLTMNTGVGFVSEALTGGVYRLCFESLSMSAGNAMGLEIYPATDAALSVGNTGTIYVGGVQVEDATTFSSPPSSYIKTTTATVTRAADSLYFPFIAPPQEMTVDCKFINLGDGNNGFLWGISNAAGASTQLFVDPNGTNFRGRYNSGAGFKDSTAAITSTFGDTVETRLALSAVGDVTVGSSKNGANEVLGATSAADTLTAAFALPTSLGLAQRGADTTTSKGFYAIQYLCVAAGTQPLSVMQAMAAGSP